MLSSLGVAAATGRRVECHGGANERLQRLLINVVALMEIDGNAWCCLRGWN
jgi:hypothetical protein